MAATLLAATIFANSAAQASCWTSEAVEAAKVRNMETMLMVSALRCRTSEKRMLDHYNSFVRSSRPVLTQVNDELRAHFVAVAGAKAGLNAYDSYVTSIANRYGAGAKGMDCEDMSRLLKAADRQGGSASSLAAVADEWRVSPDLPGRRCPARVAAAGK